MTPVAKEKKSSAADKKVSVSANKDGALFAATDSVEPENGFNVRKNKEPDEELLASIKSRGIVRPIDVRWKDRKQSKLIIVDGECRWNAAKKLGLGSVPVIVHSEMNDKEAMVLSLTANKTGRKLTRKEQDLGFRKLHHLGLEPEKIASVMAVELRFVTDALRVATKAIPEVKKAAKKSVRDGGIDSRVAGRVAGLSKAEQKKIAPKVAGLSREKGLEKVRQVEKKVGIQRPGPKAEEVVAPTHEKHYFAPDAADRCKLFEKELQGMVKYSGMDKARLYVRQALMMLQSLQNKIPAKAVLDSLNPSGKYHG